MPATRRIPALLAWHAAVATVLTGCALPVENHNQPDRTGIYVDPSTIAASLTGAVRTWVNSRQAGAPALLLATMADSYTASWRNFDMFPYSNEPRIAWANLPGGVNGSGEEVLERGWYGPYSAMASANDILRAIRTNGVSLDPPGGSQVATRRAETVSVMLQGTVLAMIALNYDSGFVATETTPPEEFDRLTVLSRQQLRDTALARFEEAIRLVEAGQFTTAPEWLGVGGGPTYTSAQLARLIRTMAAELLTMMPRNAAENAQVDWAQVVALASRGLSVPPAFDFEFITDWQVPGLYDEVRDWSNDITTIRVDTRLAHLISPNQVHPWPVPNGNPPPVTADRRLGDGSYGPEDNYLDMQGFAATGNAGTDFAWVGRQIFQANRGTYHFSNIARHRYDCAVWNNEVTQGHCQVPLYTAAVNDLLWAEGLLRSGGSRQQAAQLINRTRVGRGGLPALTGAESMDQLLAALQYEQEIEMMDIGADVFYNRRRIDGLQPFTPRHLPMPYKELDRLRRELYTYGGPDGPDMSAPAAAGGRIRNVREIYREMEARWWAEVRARRRW